MKIREWSNLIIFNLTFSSIYLTKKYIDLFGACSLILLVHVWFAPTEGPKDFAHQYFKKPDYENWTIKSDHGKSPFSRV